MALSCVRADVPQTDNLSVLIERMVDVQAEVGSLNHLSQYPLPNYEAVVAITEDLKAVLYPGHSRRDGLQLSNLAYHVGNVVDRVHQELVVQIARALCYEASHAGSLTWERRAELETQARRQALAFLEQLPSLRKILALDVDAALAGDPACRSADEAIFCYPGLEAITIYRLAHALYQLGVPVVPRMMTEWAHSRTGIDIHPGATIGRHFFIDHGTGVVIGETAVLGEWIKLYQGVTLGSLSFPAEIDGDLVRELKRHPTVEDRVVLYANATVLGGRTTIGHDAVIGSNVWLTSSVEPHSIVSLEKPRLRIRAAAGHDFVSDSDWSI